MHFTEALPRAARRFIDSAMWQLFIVGIIGLFQEWLTQSRLRWMKKVSGTILITFSVMALLCAV